jgi:F-type H+-transporting ATPase subunit delta
VNPLTFNFLRLLLSKRRLEVLRELPGAFQKCVLDERGAVEGVVETPRPLSGRDLAELERALGARIGKQVKLENRLAPELMAGARVIVDNKLLDQSATGRLEGLRQRMLRAR